MSGHKASFTPKRMSTETYARRKLQGICVKCGKNEAIANRVLCVSCAEKQRKYAKENRDFYKKHKICPRCGKNKLFGSENTCPECLAKNMIDCKKWQSKQGGSSEYYKKDIAKLKEKGLCRSCRRRSVEQGHTYCPICLEKKREKSRLYRARTKDKKCEISRSERPSYGLCYTCGEKIDRDGRVCKKCAEKLQKNFHAANVRNL